jgi:signal transduction histidine kinase
MGRRLGLRARVITAFAVGALLLSILLALVTYSLTRSNLIEARQDEAYVNTVQNALAINAELSESTDISELVPHMQSVIPPTGTLQGMVYANRGYYVDTFAFTDTELDALPEFRTRLLEAQPARMTYDINDEPHYVVGVPLPGARANAHYVQAAPLADVEQALNSLLPTLVGAAAITTVLGMGFGVYVSKRVLRPIREISDAASQIATGDLSTRLDDETDPDLDPLVQSFNGMTTTLQERIERDSRFASDVSHELRSPLMTLTGSVAVLERRRDDMPERAQLALDLLSADITRFKLLVEDLLEISRFDVGAVQLDKEEVMLGEFVRQAIGAAVARQRDVPIIYGAGTEDLIVEFDKRRVAQVIRNLSENADKYADGVTQIRLERDNDGVRIEIEDEGPGVPVDERELIFERFARGSEGGRRGSGTGVGLGLSLVTEHLRLHGGTIWVADRVDGLRGSRFVISLPDVVVPE